MTHQPRMNSVFSNRLRWSRRCQQLDRPLLSLAKEPSATDVPQLSAMSHMTTLPLLMQETCHPLRNGRLAHLIGFNVLLLQLMIRQHLGYCIGICGIAKLTCTEGHPKL